MESAQRSTKCYFWTLIGLGVLELAFFITKGASQDCPNMKWINNIDCLTILPLIFITAWFAIMFFLQRNNEATHFTAMEGYDHKLAIVELWDALNIRFDVIMKEYSESLSMDFSNPPKEGHRIIYELMIKDRENIINKMFIELTHNITPTLAGNGKNKVDIELLNIITKLANKEKIFFC